MRKNFFILYFIFIYSYIFAQAPTLTAPPPAASPGTGMVNKIDYLDMMAKGDYDLALLDIINRINAINETRVDEKRVPSSVITIGSAEEGIDLNKLFSQRKGESFFIEENQELFKLHFNAGICYHKKKELSSAINHLYQSLRYRPLAYNEDDIVFFEIAQTYKDMGEQKAYISSMITAYELRPTNYEYSLEIGKALYRTNDKKKAIFHLQRYVEASSISIEDPNVYIMLGNLNSDIGKYLETAKYYKKYLDIKPDDPYALFSLGCLYYEHIGDFESSLSFLKRAVAVLPEKDVVYKAKCYEYIGDIDFKNLKFKEAVASYEDALKFEKSVKEGLDKKKQEIDEKSKEIRDIKIDMIKQNNFLKYTEYQFQNQERERLRYELMEKNYEYGKISSGKICWNIAECNEKLNNLEKAIEFYRTSISYDYKSSQAREKIVKLQLKIKRGY